MILLSHNELNFFQFGFWEYGIAAIVNNTCVWSSAGGWVDLYDILFPLATYYYTIVFNSLASGRSECNSENLFFNLILLIGIFRSSHDNALWWMPQDLTDDKSTLVQVMAWCRQATSYYLSQCWLSSLSPYGIARPQWVKLSNVNPSHISSRVI